MKRLLTLALSIVFLSAFATTGQASQWRRGVPNGYDRTEFKVDWIMGLFHCKDRIIRTAILKTFDPELVAVTIAIESSFRKNALGPGGECRGLMQLSADKLADWRDPEKNIAVGARYLQVQLRRFGTKELAAAAYNAGPENVRKYNGVPPFRETQGYVKKLRYFYEKMDSVDTTWFIWSSFMLRGDPAC